MARNCQCITIGEYLKIKERCEKLLKSASSTKRSKALEKEFAWLVNKFKTCYVSLVSGENQVDSSQLGVASDDSKMAVSVEAKVPGKPKKKVRRKGKLKKGGKGPVKKVVKKKPAIKKKPAVKKKKIKPAKKKRKKGVGKKRIGKKRLPKKKKKGKLKAEKTEAEPESSIGKQMGLTEEVFRRTCEYYDHILGMPPSEQKIKAIEQELPSLLRTLKIFLCTHEVDEEDAQEVFSEIFDGGNAVTDLVSKLAPVIGSDITMASPLLHSEIGGVKVAKKKKDVLPDRKDEKKIKTVLRGEVVKKPKKDRKKKEPIDEDKKGTRRGKKVNPLEAFYRSLERQKKRRAKKMKKGQETTEEEVVKKPKKVKKVKKPAVKPVKKGVKVQPIKKVARARARFVRPKYPLGRDVVIPQTGKVQSYLQLTRREGETRQYPSSESSSSSQIAPPVSQDHRGKWRELFNALPGAPELYPAPKKMVNKARFVAIREHCQRLLDSPDSEERSKLMEAELKSLLTNFRTLFNSQTSLMYKLKESTAELAARDAEIERLKGKILDLDESKLKVEQRFESALETTHQLALEKEELHYKLGIALNELDIYRQKDLEQSAPQKKSDLFMDFREMIIAERNVQKELIEKLTAEVNNLQQANSELQADLQRNISESQHFRDTYSEILNNWQMEVKNHLTTSKELTEAKRHLSQNVDEIKSLNKKLEDTESNLQNCQSRLHQLQIEHRRSNKAHSVLKQNYSKMQKNIDLSETKFRVLMSENSSLSKALEDKSENTTSLKTELVREKTKSEKKIRLLEGRLMKSENKIERLEVEKTELSMKISDLEEQKLQLLNTTHENKQTVPSPPSPPPPPPHESEKSCKNHIAQKDGAGILLLERQLAMVNSKYAETLKKVTALEKIETKLLKRVNDLVVQNDNLNDRIRHQMELEQSYQEKISELEKGLADESTALHDAKQELTFFKLHCLKTQGRWLINHEGTTNKNTNTIATEKTEEPPTASVNEAPSVVKHDTYRLMEEKLKRIRRQNFELTCKLEVKTEVAKRAKAESLQKSAQIKLISSQTKHQPLETKVESLVKENVLLRNTITAQTRDIGQLNGKLEELNKALALAYKEHRSRIWDIEVLKREIAVLARYKGLNFQKADDLKDQRIELIRLQRDLNKERLTTRALESEMQSTRNVSAWRQLETTDPDRYHLLCKNHYLQKKLVNSMVLVDQKDHELDELRKTVDELKDMLNRKPNHDIYHHVQKYRVQYEKENEKVESLTAQLNMYKTVCMGRNLPKR